MPTNTSECNLDEQCFIDDDKQQWGYDVVCVNPDHAERACPDEHEMFRLPRAANGTYGNFSLSRMAEWAVLPIIPERPLIEPGTETIIKAQGRLAKISSRIGQLFSR